MADTTENTPIVGNWRHIGKGGTYYVLRSGPNILVQVNDVWKEAVIYASTDITVGKEFIRDKEDFLLKFEKIN